MTLTVQPFSSEYLLIDGVDIFTHNNPDAEMDIEMFRVLSQAFGEHFMGLTDGIHYQFEPVNRIPKDAIALPERNHTNPETLLIQK